MSVYARLLAILMLCVPSLVMAEEEADPEPGHVEVVTSDRLRELIQNLNADRYSIRQSATKELSAAGEAAIPLLVETARKGSAEAASRCVQVLEKHLQGDNETAQAAAKKSLRELADTARESTARLAKKALGEDVAELDLDQEEEEDPFGPLPPANPLGGGRFQIQMQMNGLGGTRVTRRVVNGVKDTTIDDNGKKIKIHEEPNGKIKMSVTEPGDGDEPKTKTYEADNAEELKKKHAEAHELYKRYTREGPRIRIGPQGIGLNPLIPGRVFPPGEIALPKDIAPPKDEEGNRLKRTVELLKELKLGDLNEDERKVLRDELERALNELDPKEGE